MKLKRNCLMLVMVSAIAVTLTSISASAQKFVVEDLQEVQVNMLGASLGSPPWEIVNEFWSKTVPQMSGGKITAKVQSVRELGLKGPETMRMLKRGVTQMVDEAIGFYSGDIPENDGMDLAGLAPDLVTLRKAVNVYEPTLAKLYEERLDAKLLGLWPLAGQVIWCRVPITDLDSLKGKKIRVFTASMADFIEAIGAVPTSISFGEVVPSLQRNVVDCAVTGTVAGNLSKWTEVTTHVYPLVVGWAVHAITANKQWWDNLEPITQAWLYARVQDMVAIGWQQAEVGTNQGLWCSTGDSRCQLDSIKPRAMTNAKLTLVKVTDADKKKALKLLAEQALPKFAKRCGEDCTANWNATVGKVFGVTAQAK